MEENISITTSKYCQKQSYPCSPNHRSLKKAQISYQSGTVDPLFGSVSENNDPVNVQMLIYCILTEALKLISLVNLSFQVHMQFPQNRWTCTNRYMRVDHKEMLDLVLFLKKCTVCKIPCLSMKHRIHVEVVSNISSYLLQTTQNETNGHSQINVTKGPKLEAQFLMLSNLKVTLSTTLPRI